MSVTIYEALQNARHNLDHIIKRQMPLSMLGPLTYDQLNNAVTLLEKGYDLHTLVEPLLEKYVTIENVPEKEGRDV